MTTGQMVKTYFLRFQMSGISQALVYPVSQEDNQRMQNVLQRTEKEHQAQPFFFFTTTDEQKVIVSRRDIQMVTFGWDLELVLDDEETEPLPKIEIYFRDRPEPYREFLGDPGDLETIFLANTFDIAGEPFTYFLDDDGEEAFFRPDQVVLLTYFWQEEKRNRSLVYRVRGPAPDDASSSGVWRIQAWQSDQEEGWNSDLEFVADGQATAVIIESYGPGSAKTEAVEMARRGLETSWLNPRDPPLF